LATGFTIQISSNNTFTALVSTGSPTGAAYTPAVNLPKNVPLYWRVLTRNANGQSNWSSPVASFMSANPPSDPSLLLPAENALLYNLRPRLDWNDSTVPAGTTFDRYQLQLATDPAFMNIVFDQDTSVSEFVPPAPLASNTKYYWRVRSYNTLGHYSSWSAVRSFRESMSSPVLLLPGNGTQAGSLRPTFDWTDVTGATGYTIQISTSATFGTLLVNSPTVPSTYRPASALPSGTTLYWRVRANGPNGPTKWVTFQFTTP